MSTNYEKAIASIKEKNGGQLPSDLYTKTNSELSKILYDLTGDFKYKLNQRVSKEALVKRVERLTMKVAPTKTIGIKRSAEEENVCPQNEIGRTSIPLKTPRNVMGSLSPVQVAQMKRVMAITPDHLAELKHEKDLRPLWSSIGMTAKYPNTTGKEKIFERLKNFSETNLKFHGYL